MTSLVHFMNASFGRAARVLLGAGLLGYGLLALGGAAGILVAVVGLVPIGLGLKARCLLEPLAPARQA